MPTTKEAYENRDKIVEIDGKLYIDKSFEYANYLARRSGYVTGVFIPYKNDETEGAE